MTALIITAIILAAAAAAAAVARARFHEAWGRDLDRALDRYVSGGSWVSATSTSEALSLELIRRYDRLMAGAGA